MRLRSVVMLLLVALSGCGERVLPSDTAKSSNLPAEASLASRHGDHAVQDAGRSDLRAPRQIAVSDRDAHPVPETASQPANLAGEPASSIASASQGLTALPPNFATYHLALSWDSKKMLAFGASLLINLILTVFVMVLFKWRRRVKNAVVTAVPVELLSLGGIVRRHTAQAAQDTHSGLETILAQISTTNESLVQVGESLEIMKTELDAKDRIIAQLRMGNQSDEKLILAKKVTKLYLLLDGLRHSIATGKVNEAAALEFLASELVGVFDDLGIDIVRPKPGSSIADLSGDSFSVGAIIRTTEQQLHDTIASVTEPGFQIKLTPSKTFSLRPAIVVVHALGN